jgi:hypothetical protein
MSLLDHLWNNGFIAAGDLEGDGASQTVVGLRGNPINVGTPLVGQALVWNGSSWVYEDWVKPTLDTGDPNTLYWSNGTGNGWSPYPIVSTLQLHGEDGEAALELPDNRIGIALKVGGVQRTILERRATAGQIDFGHTSYALNLVTNGTVYVPPVVQFVGTGVRYLASEPTSGATGQNLIISAQYSTHGSGVGGNLLLHGGAGVTSGYVALAYGASERLRSTANGVLLGGNGSNARIEAMSSVPLMVDATYLYIGTDQEKTIQICGKDGINIRPMIAANSTAPDDGVMMLVGNGEGGNTALRTVDHVTKRLIAQMSGSLPADPKYWKGPLLAKFQNDDGSEVVNLDFGAAFDGTVYLVQSGRAVCVRIECTLMGTGYSIDSPFHPRPIGSWKKAATYYYDQVNDRLILVEGGTQESHENETYPALIAFQSEPSNRTVNVTLTLPHEEGDPYSWLLESVVTIWQGE